MRKLIVLPAFPNALGGVTVSLSLMIKGLEQKSRSEQICVLAQADSLLEQYLRQADQAYCLQLIPASDRQQFIRRALQWAAEQPQDWPLLLESFVCRKSVLRLAQATLSLRLSGRPVYHFFHDLAHSYNPLGNAARKLTFACLSPGAICNSHFTASHVRANLLSQIQGILYQPVDTERFNDRPSVGQPPASLQPIINSGAKIMLTPSRLSKPENFNDKNLRALIPLLAQLKSLGHHYHGVIVGPDYSPGKERSQNLLEQAETMGVADRFTILPPTFAIEDYYRHADVVVTLAPREPFGRTTVEAIACGVPVVGSQTGGIGEILGHFAPQWRVAPDDPAAAAQAVIRVATDSDTKRILAQGKHWVVSHCSHTEYAKRVMEITGLGCQNLWETSLAY